MHFQFLSSSDAHSRRRLTYLLAALAVAWSFVVLNRWAFTSLGLESFGRVWQLYISYADMGFVRRALVGTVFSETGINRLVGNEYVFALAMHHICILLIAGLVARFIVRQRIADPWLIASVMLSPALIIQSGYVTGALDTYVLIAALMNILFVRSLWLFSLVLVLGVLMHELFIFTIPAQCIALAIRKNMKLDHGKTLGMFLLPVGLAMATLLVVLLCGKTVMGREAFEQIMLVKLPHAAHQHGLWSGYFEVAASVDNNVQSAARIGQQLSGKLYYIVLPLLYLLLAVGRAMMFAKGRWVKMLVCLASVAPLLTYFVATDFYRWLGMSANMALGLSLVLVAHEAKPMPRWLNYAILAFTLLAPFGSLPVERPFPMHQFVLEKLR